MSGKYYNQLSTYIYRKEKNSILYSHWKIKLLIFEGGWHPKFKLNLISVLYRIHHAKFGVSRFFDA